MRTESKRKPNWLLRGLILISLGIHAVIFMHIAGIYHSKALSVIELTMKDISRPPSRSIPRPRLRPKNTLRPSNIKEIKVRKSVIPRLKPMKAEPVQRDLPDTLMERISMPDIPDDAGPGIAAWEPGDQMAETGDYNTSNDYLDMVRLRIESHKKYPETARGRRVEGRTTIHFVIEPDGRVSSLKVARGSRNKALDKAAFSAVKESSPFPRPPAHLFKGPIPLELTIVFELT